MKGLDGMEWHQCCQGTIPMAPTLPERQPKPNCRAQHPPEGQGAELRIVYQPHDSIAHDQKQHGAGAAGERGGAQQHGGRAGWVDRVVGGQAHPALQQVGGHHCSVQDPAGAMEDEGREEGGRVRGGCGGAALGATVQAGGGSTLLGAAR